MTIRTTFFEGSRETSRAYPIRRPRFTRWVVNGGRGQVWRRALILVLSCITFLAVVVQVLTLASSRPPRVYSAQALADMVEPTPPTSTRPPAQATQPAPTAKSQQQARPPMPELCVVPTPRRQART